MKALTAEWVKKADEEFSVATGLVRRKVVPADSVCFHCQQATEKLLKALLQEAAVAFGKTHDLEELERLATPSYPSLSLVSADLVLLNDYAVRYRYPGMDATRLQAREAVAALRRVRKAILPLL